jgi:plasmid stability protein
MATLTTCNLDEDLKAPLRVRAAQHGRSMEEDARTILRAALISTPGPGCGAALMADRRALVESFGGIELDLPPREPMREPPSFSAFGADECSSLLPM